MKHEYAIEWLKLQKRMHEDFLIDGVIPKVLMREETNVIHKERANQIQQAIDVLEKEKE